MVKSEDDRDPSPSGLLIQNDSLVPIIIACAQIISTPACTSQIPVQEISLKYSSTAAKGNTW